KAGTTILFFSLLVWALMSFPRTAAVGTAGPGVPEKKTHLENTFAGKFGKAIEPALRPMGFDWRIGVALTAGFAAKEVIVSTLGTIYSIGEEGNGPVRRSLQESLRNDPTLDPVKGYGLMLFILLYVPCVATLGVVKREAGGWKWAALLAIYTTGLAWLVSFAFIRIAQMIG
ncbi:MAG: nucleoside recognition domain-containing protein, partial [Candidatus Latescibacterota bacterium]